MRFIPQQLRRKATLRTAGALLAVLCFGSARAFAGGPVPGSSTVFADGPAETAPLATTSLLLSVARAGSTLVAVGDRGHILVSRDHGVSWAQRPSPTRVMLTGISFSDPQNGWAVGHAGVALQTTDGGEIWSRRDVPGDAETVFLNVHFADAAHGWIVGAYGKFLATTDGGKTWQPRTPNADEVHFNHLGSATDGRLVLAGETGTLLFSADQGNTWTQAGVPYDGSLFGSLATGTDSLVAFGLRGHVFASRDRGENWQPVPTESTALLMAGVKLRTGVVVLAGQGGNFFVSRNAGASFTPWKPERATGSVAALAEAADGALIAVGESGAVRLLPPAAETP